MKSPVKYILLSAAAVLLLIGLSSCTQGLSMEETEDIKVELQDVSTRLAAIEQSLSSLKGAEEDEIAALADETIGDAKQELAQVVSRLHEIESMLEFPDPAAEQPMDEPMGDPMGTEPAGF